MKRVYQLKTGIMFKPDSEISFSDRGIACCSGRLVNLVAPNTTGYLNKAVKEFKFNIDDVVCSWLEE